MNIGKYIVEFIGTFFLVLVIGLTVLSGAAGVIPPIAIGVALVVLVYAGGHFSGAHYNPAVTLAVFLRGKCPATDVVPYIFSQLVGATSGAFMAMYLTDTVGPNTPLGNVPRAFAAELLFTFALTWVILNVATAKANATNSFYGLAIGGTVMAGAFAVGHISGAAFNPAVAVAAGIMKLIPIQQIWVHLTAEILGAAAAAIVFKTVIKE